MTTSQILTLGVCFITIVWSINAKPTRPGAYLAASLTFIFLSSPLCEKLVTFAHRWLDAALQVTP